MSLTEITGLSHPWCWIIGAALFIAGYFVGSIRMFCEMHREDADTRGDGAGED